MSVRERAAAARAEHDAAVAAQREAERARLSAEHAQACRAWFASIGLPDVEVEGLPAPGEYYYGSTWIGPMARWKIEDLQGEWGRESYWDRAFGDDLAACIQWWWGEPKRLYNNGKAMFKSLPSLDRALAALDKARAEHPDLRLTKELP